MASRIYLPVDLAGDKEVILVNGECYQRVGPSELPPDTFDVQDEFETCDECESSPSSSGSSSETSSEPSSGSTSEPSVSWGSSSCGDCTLPVLAYDDVGGSGGTAWIAYPDLLCLDGGTQLITFFDPGGLGGHVVIELTYLGASLTITSTDPDATISIPIGENKVLIDFDTSLLPRTLTVGFMLTDPTGPPVHCVVVQAIGGIFVGNGRSVLEYPSR